MKPQVEEALEAELLKRAQRDLKHVAVSMVREGPGVIINEPLKTSYDKILHNYVDRNSILGSEEVTPASAAFNRARYALAHYEDLGPETLVRSLGDLWREGGGTCVRKDVAEEALVTQMMIGTPGRPKIEAAKLLSATCGTLTPAGGRVVFHGLGFGTARLKEGHYTPEGASLYGVNLPGLNLSGAIFRKAGLETANFSGSNLDGADFSRSQLSRASFVQASLRNANFQLATLRDASFAEANLQGANLSSVRGKEVRLHGADLTGARLDNAILTEASANTANFSKASLKGAFLVRALLNSTEFAGADLSNSSLDDAEVMNANFRGADLRGVSMKDTIVRVGKGSQTADFTGALRDKQDTHIPGWRRNASGRLEKDGT